MMTDASSYFDHDYTANLDEVSASLRVLTDDHRAAFLRWIFLYNLALGLTDLAVMAVSVIAIASAHAFTLSYVDRHGQSGLVGLPLLITLFALAWMASLWFTGCYKRHLMGEGYDLYARILQAAIACVLLAGAAVFFLRVQLPRTQVMLTILLACLLTGVDRWLWRRILHSFRLHGRMGYPVTLVGTWGGVSKALKDIHNNPGLGYKPIAIAPIERGSDGRIHAARRSQGTFESTLEGTFEGTAELDQASSRAHALGLPVLTFNSHLPATARHLGSQVVLLTDGMERGSRAFSAFSLSVQASGMELSIPVTTTGDINAGFSFYLHNTADAMPVLTTSIPQFNRFSAVAKRLCDIVLSLIALVLCAIPMLCVAIAVKAEDGGPVFYTQKRVGQYGKPFTMYKFRSMIVGADKMEKSMARTMGQDTSNTFKVHEDPRVTRVGRFIRRTSLDELPQLFNILTGTMSFVGPRPQLPYQRDRDNAVYATRLLVKQGLTGLWQISGRADLSDRQGEQLDVWYVANHSLAGDAAILLKTIPAVLRGTGAY